MNGANRKAEAPKPRHSKTIGFDYDKVGEATAEQMRGAADCVRGLMRASVVEVGRELLKIKAQIEHGQFTEWVRLECELHIRTAQRAMQAAELVEKNDKLSYLPADGLTALSSRDAGPIAEEIISLINAGDRPTAAEIKRKMKPAVRGENTPSRSGDPVDQIQGAITKLNEGELRRLAKWFDRFRKRGRSEANPERDSPFPDRPMFALPAAARLSLPVSAEPPLPEHGEPQVPEQADSQLSAEAEESEELTCRLPLEWCRHSNACRSKGRCLGALAEAKAKSRAAAAAESERAAQ